MDQVVALEHHPAIPPAAPLMSADLGDPHCSAREPPLGDPPARDTPIQSNPRKKEIYYQPPIQSNPIQPRSDRNGAGGDEPDEPDEPPTIAAVLPDAAAGLVERLAALDDPAQVYGRALRAIYATVPELRESRYVAMEAARLVSDGAVYPQELRRVLLDCRAMRESTGGLRNAAGFFHAKVKIWPGWREPIGTAARARESDKPP